MGAYAIERDRRGLLVVTLPSGERFTDVVPVRAFPFTDPARYVSFVDPKGHEVHCLVDPSVLPADAKTLLDEELSRREFIPLIRRIHEVAPRSEPSTWHVDTDRGEVRFTLPSEDNIRRLGPDGALVADEHGVRYRIASIEKLDAHSRRILRRYL